MSLKPLPLAPGLYTINTSRGAKGRWKDGDHVRFRHGLSQKLGGWTKVISSAVFAGKARGVKDWAALSVQKIIGMGTHLKLYVWIGGTFSDITPIRESSTLANDPFAVVNTSTTVTVTDVDHGLSVGDYAHYSGATAGGGITINGEYAVVTVPTTGSYTITHSTPATSTDATTGGAAVAYSYEVPVGTGDSAAGLGYGIGPYGASTYGTARSVSGLLNMCRIWSLDNWGEDLIACPRGGGIYVWDSSTGVGTRAVVVTNAPTTCKAILMSSENRHLIALGAHDGAVSDPLLIRWCSSEDYTAWTASVTNTAGDKRLDFGNEIYCCIKTSKESAIFTDSTLYTMTFDGPPYTFGFSYIGLNGGIAGPNAAKEQDGRVFWMGKGNFFVYDGAIKTLFCEVLNHVFDDINWTQRAKIYAGSNREFSEVWWLYPTAASTECDAYVIYNVVENHWTYGTLARTFIVGDSDTFPTPYAAGTDGYLYHHESGVDDDASALESSLESGDVDIDDGEYLMHVRKVVPDFKTLDGSISLTLNGKEYPGSSETIASTAQTITATTKFVNPRIRARQVSVSLVTTAVGDDWRMGTLRLDVKQHGKK